jgi:prolyl-tRNA synthetase
MFWSKAFIPTLKETPQETESVSHQLMLRAGLVRMLMAGVYSYLPLGWKVLGNIQRIIQEEMNKSGATELLLPTLQPQELWLKSGRDQDIGLVMIRFIDRRGRKVCLGPTHEEVITELVRTHVCSYKQMPLVLYQIQTKFRDEIRPRFGVVRACEFIMKDAYSFDQDQAGLEKNYAAMFDAYQAIFRRAGLRIVTVEADPGVMGGKVSHEFMVPAPSGEDVILICPRCNLAQAYHKGNRQPCPKCTVLFDTLNTIEIGHIFQLGTKYSDALGAQFLDAEGKLKSIIMGCYGIGVSRLMAAIIEQNHDENGIIWPKEISPYQVVILPLDMTDKRITEKSGSIYETLLKMGTEVLFDDRDERAGVKFKDADLLGITVQVILGKEFLKHGFVELKVRRANQKITTTEAEVFQKIQEVLSG